MKFLEKQLTFLCQEIQLVNLLLLLFTSKNKETQLQNRNPKIKDVTKTDVPIKKT